jgi:hypothetical protein
VLNRVTVRRWAILGLGAVLAGVLAGGVVAAQLGGLGDPETVVSAMRNDPLVRVATIGAAGNQPSRGVFVQTTSTGQLCLWDAPASGGPNRQGGCNSIDDPLGGAKLSASLSYQGGPAADRVSEARLIGLVASDVASVQVLMSDGTRRQVPMRREAAVALEATSFRAFGYRFDPADFARGVEPKVVLALNARGEEVDRQTTGFSG